MICSKSDRGQQKEGGERRKGENEGRNAYRGRWRRGEGGEGRREDRKVKGRLCNEGDGDRGREGRRGRERGEGWMDINFV